MRVKLSDSNTIAIILLPPAEHRSLSGTRMALKWPLSPVRSFPFELFQDANTTCSQRPGGCLCAGAVSLTICCPVQQRRTCSSEKRSERGSCHNVYMPVWWRGCFSSADTKKGLKGAAPCAAHLESVLRSPVTILRRRLDICSQHPYWINSQFHGRPWGSLLLTTVRWLFDSPVSTLTFTWSPSRLSLQS